MVYYFTSNVSDPPTTLFMGFDKYENEELIRWGWPEDVWFHVDKVSSAHVYLRLKPGETIETIPKATIEDCAQLCKANSITGNKMNNVDVIYTMWSNLKKTPGMEPGQVSFFKDKEVYKIRLEKRINEIVNRLNKTKREEKPDFRFEREERDRRERNEKKAEFKKQQEIEKVLEKKREEEAKLRSYDSLMQSANMTSNMDAGNDSDDFM
ncbi:coiled-coil domain-containing protein 25-like [Pollicipes pollicipes]|uniref:coiled-coil domain-containing protein 25-like n=1 Tax=Pollicipes pollicipes TaxID=41117 RepID=UPI001884C181|nr:coiled-coil domain-containing protein 25-like [Pollicipes pollicipes]XP_037067993.1 coiled-coil domain-containing protein 25-like [Pollicipes pollicipes]XP_037067994.1 coiled-coil domain-containing protein 25-like [Pollicipes pollicipes]XP_037067995.1 coiled-coil domain-containing protein 25-like [Pollicipes pollicipes]